VAEAEPAFVSLPIALEGYTERVIEMASWAQCQFVRQGEFILTIGQAHPPVVVGDSSQERRQSLEQAGYITVKVLGKYSMTLQRLQELIQALQTCQQQYQEAVKRGMQ